MSQQTAFYAKQGVAAQLMEVIEAAVIPDQIAAVLESHGYNDQTISQKYGYPNVFALAENLYRSTPRKYTSAKPKTGDLSNVWREVTHGPFYVMPGLFFPPAFAILGWDAVVGIILSVTLGWSWVQGVVRLGYILLGRGFPLETRVFFRFMLSLGMGLALALGLLLAMLLKTGPGLVALVLLQTTYMIIQAILIFYKREKDLMIASFPALAAGLAFLLGQIGVLPAVLAIGASVLLGLLVTLARLWTRPSPSFWRCLEQSDYVEGIPLVLYGFLTSVFISIYPFLYWIQKKPIATKTGLEIVPLVLSLGVLIWQERIFVERGRLLLASTGSLLVFKQYIYRELFLRLASYGLVLLALTLLAWVVFHLHSLESQLLLTANFLLGIGFFLSVALNATGCSKKVLGGMLLALAVYATTLGVLSGGIHLLALEAAKGYLMGSGVFVLYILLVGLPVLRDPRKYL
ncbi:MAG: hypothetical protein ACUVSF_09245 [Anaerolineae bacterium]